MRVLCRSVSATMFLWSYGLGVYIARLFRGSRAQMRLRRVTKLQQGRSGPRLFPIPMLGPPNARTGINTFCHHTAFAGLPQLCGFALEGALLKGAPPPRTPNSPRFSNSTFSNV